MISRVRPLTPGETNGFKPAFSFFTGSKKPAVWRRAGFLIGLYRRLTP
jgi:hypothetical protein